jgi:hypothetical protein
MSANIIENRVTALEQRVDSIERQQNELKQFERTLIKRDLFLATIQIIAMVLAIFGAGSYLSYQNSKLIEQIDKRIEESNHQIEKRIEESNRQIEKRIDDLRQVVLSDRQQRERR